MKRVFPLLGFAVLTACVPAQMQLSPSLAQSRVRAEIAGIGGRTSGQFMAGSYSGSFDRSLESWSFADTAVVRGGHNYLSVSGPEISSTIEAHCAMRERAIDLGSGVEVTVRSMAYRCEFTAGGRPIPARFELQESQRGGLAVFRYERIGEIALGGEIVQFRSVHRIDGAALPTITPSGYVFEQAGREIGAVDLANRPALVLSPALDKGLARTVTVAALVLATFWDPAIHDPDA
ncbi:hypothetical protein N0B51_04680 [Tsuneonella sp. YG55]|uniref:DUF3108 domain-containing protein n=1 Tax=Tsuneonella litorea TaxID=2976475 RepID=A0A9X2W0B7_9SPHN|nr:hypothetical protein [Tsuneonella litorea]MCT2558268.1 hypothetical protein [Tsuneonella litorea]